MTDISALHAEQIAQAHRRLDAQDSRLTTVEGLVTDLKVLTAQEAVRSRNIEAQLKEIKSAIHWVGGLVIGGFITAAIGYALSGGFHVGS